MPPSDKASIQASFASIRAAYEADPKQKTYNALVCGESGTGKSFLLRTCRQPILVDSFDPGGTKSLINPIPGLASIKEGTIIADIRWEEEPDPDNPSLFNSWATEMNRRFKEGMFNHLGTYAIDSCTMWSAIIMDKFTKGRPVTLNFDQHWGPQQREMSKFIKRLMSLPCDFILTGHLEKYADTIKKGKDIVDMTVLGYRLMATGRLSVEIPLIFDEVYVTQVIAGAKGPKYQLLTQSTGKYLAFSRWAAGGLFKTIEEPNIKALLVKAGLPATDKTL